MSSDSGCNAVREWNEASPRMRAHNLIISLEKSVYVLVFALCLVHAYLPRLPELYMNNKKRIRCWLVVETTRVTAYAYINGYIRYVNGQQTAEPLFRPILLSEDDATRSKQLKLLPDEARRCVHSRVCGLAAACLRTRCPSLFAVPPGVGMFQCACCACTMACTRPHHVRRGEFRLNVRAPARTMGPAGCKSGARACARG